MPQYTRQRVAAQTSGFAIAALILGILGFIPGISLLAIVFGIIALVQIGNNQGRLQGRGMAITGLACSILVPAVVYLAVVLPYIASVNAKREEAYHRRCMSNQRQLSLAITMYCTENEEVLPGKIGLTPASAVYEKQQWRNSDIIGVASTTFDCKTSGLSGLPGAEAEYGMNAKIMGIGLGQIADPSAVLLTADTKGVDAIFSTADIDARHREHERSKEKCSIASFVDGHIEVMKAGRPVKLQ